MSRTSRQLTEPIIRDDDDKELEIVATDIFYRNQETQKPIVIDRGGAGSSKSHSLEQLMLYKFFNETRKKIFICRKSLPALRRSCYYEMDQLASEYGVRDQIIEEKVHLNWHYGDNLISFGSLDDPEKAKSFNVNYVWMEEATEFTYDDFQQLRRCLRNKTIDGMRNQMFLSFNPIDEFHWIKTRILDDPSYADDIVEIHSTYRDNPFLEEDAVKVLQGYEQQDISFYNIYTLGQWGKLENLVYRGWESVDYMPETSDRTIYGLDFGFNEPSVLERILIKGKDAWIDERIHHTKLTTTDLILKMQSAIPENEKRCTIYADPSSPEVIKEIKDAGFNIKPAIRSLNPGIDFVKSFKLHIYSGGINTQKEFRAYSWKKDRDGNVTDDPVGAFDHAPDAVRYALYTALKGGSGFRVRILG